MDYWVLKALVVGAGGGFIGGMLGVGGGIIMVPLLMLLLKMPIHDAKATSLGIIVVIAVAGTIQHQRLGRLDAQEWAIILVAGVTAAALSALGAWVSEMVPRHLLLRLFALIMIASGFRYLAPSRGGSGDTPAEPAVVQAK